MKFTLLENSNDIYLIRATDAYGIISKEDQTDYGQFFLQIRNHTIQELINKKKKIYSNYGLVDIYKLSPQANIYTTPNRFQGIIDNQLWNYKSKILLKITKNRFSTLKQIIEYIT